MKPLGTARRHFLKTSITAGAALLLNKSLSAQEPARSVTYALNAELPVLKPGYPGVTLVNGAFTNNGLIFHKGFGTMLKWASRGNPQEEEKKKDSWRLPVIRNTGIFDSKEDMIVWLGHASFLIRLNGRTLLTDPCFFNLPFRKRLAEMPCAPESIHNVDIVLQSHGHYDHLDSRSMALVKGNAPQALVPLAMAPLIRKFNSGLKVQEAAWFQEYRLDSDIRVIFLPAKHWHKRGLFDTNKVLWGGFLVIAGERSLFFAGDTAYGPHFKEINELFGSPQYCLLPIGAYKPPYIMQDNHLNPSEAVQAFHDLKGRTLIPMHYGTYDLSDEPLGEPLRLLRELEKRGDIQGVLQVLDAGEELRV